MSKYESHSANALGDFYVENDCCTTCGVPFVAAPELFAEYNDPEGWTHCYVKRQPANTTELNDMINAISQAEFGCIRYKGQDEKIQRRLVQIGEAGQCDQLLPQYQKWYQLERSQPQSRAGAMLRSLWHRLSRLVRNTRA